MLKGYIAKYGGIEVVNLWEAPLTSIDTMGRDWVFPDKSQCEGLLKALEVINVA